MNSNIYYKIKLKPDISSHRYPMSIPMIDDMKSSSRSPNSSITTGRCGVSTVLDMYTSAWTDIPGSISRSRFLSMHMAIQAHDHDQLAVVGTRTGRSGRHIFTNTHK